MSGVLYFWLCLVAASGEENLSCGNGGEGVLLRESLLRENVDLERRTVF